MSKGRLLAFAGDPRCGKDTLADMFAERQGYTKVAFADPLYEEVSDAYGVSVESLRSPEWKSVPQVALTPRKCPNTEFRKVAQQAGWFNDEPMTSRQVLQLWGTEYRRAKRDDYWVGQMIGRLRNFRNKGIHDIVFSDLRFDIEACMGHWHVSKGIAINFKVIEILRAGTVQSAHTSDKGISKFLIDGTVRNNTSPEDCYLEIANILERGQEKRSNG